MKRFVTMSIMVFACALAFAQAIPQLDRAQGVRVSFHYQYSISRDGGDFTDVTVGNVTVEDNAYRLDGLGLCIISDGDTLWTMDNDAQELIVENVDKESILVNPALLIASYRHFRKDITVMGSSDNSLDIIYQFEEGVRARFVLTDIVYSEPEGKSDLTLDVKSLPESFIVTDLR